MPGPDRLLRLNWPCSLFCLHWNGVLTHLLNRAIGCYCSKSITLFTVYLWPFAVEGRTGSNCHDASSTIMSTSSPLLPTVCLVSANFAAFYNVVVGVLAPIGSHFFTCGFVQVSISTCITIWMETSNDKPTAMQSRSMARCLDRIACYA